MEVPKSPSLREAGGNQELQESQQIGMSAYIPPLPGLLGSWRGGSSTQDTHGDLVLRSSRSSRCYRGVGGYPRAPESGGALDIFLAKYFPNRPFFRNLVWGKPKIIIDLQSLLLPGG